MADKKQRKMQQQNKQRMQRQRTLLQQHKNEMMPFVKFLKKEGLPFKYARVGQNRIQYFRFDDLNKLRDSEEIQVKLKKLEEKNKQNIKIRTLFQRIQKPGADGLFVYYRRPSDSKSLKYPHILQPTSPNDPQGKFCSFKFDTTISRKTLMFSILGAAMALVLFPVWPFTVKYAIWLISLYLLIFLIGLLLFRIVIYLICVVLGYNVWILPNLLGDYGFIESFKPFVYAQRWQKSTFNIIIRVAAFALLVFYGVQLYLDPTFLESHFSVTKNTIDQIHDWGVSKIKNEKNFSQRAITNLQDILNQTADVETQQQQRQQQSHQQNEENTIQNQEMANKVINEPETQTDEEQNENEQL